MMDGFKLFRKPKSSSECYIIGNISETKIIVISLENSGRFDGEVSWSIKCLQ